MWEAAGLDADVYEEYIMQMTTEEATGFLEDLGVTNGDAANLVASLKFSRDTVANASLSKSPERALSAPVWTPEQDVQHLDRPECVKLTISGKKKEKGVTISGNSLGQWLKAKAAPTNPHEAAQSTVRAIGSFQIVDQDDDSFVCGICLDVARNPVVLDCNGEHLACSVCWTQLVSAARNKSLEVDVLASSQVENVKRPINCPLCKQFVPLKATLLSDNARRWEKYQCIKLQCDREECTWRGTLNEFDAHRDWCGVDLSAEAATAAASRDTDHHAQHTATTAAQRNAPDTRSSPRAGRYNTLNWHVETQSWMTTHWPNAPVADASCPGSTTGYWPSACSGDAGFAQHKGGKSNSSGWWEEETWTKKGKNGSRAKGGGRRQEKWQEKKGSPQAWHPKEKWQEKKGSSHARHPKEEWREKNEQREKTGGRGNWGDKEREGDWSSGGTPAVDQNWPLGQQWVVLPPVAPLSHAAEAVTQHASTDAPTGYAARGMTDALGMPPLWSITHSTPTDPSIAALSEGMPSTQQTPLAHDGSSVLSDALANALTRGKSAPVERTSVSCERSTHSADQVCPRYRVVTRAKNDAKPTTTPSKRENNGEKRGRKDKKPVELDWRGVSIDDYSYYDVEVVSSSDSDLD